MQTKVNPKDLLTYVWIPPGSFLMGTTEADHDDEVRSYLDEKNKWIRLHNERTYEKGPVTLDDIEEKKFVPAAYRVTITRGFWMGQTPVTQEAYELVMGNNPSRFKGPRLPVEGVSWHDAKAYCEAVGMRLPTEAEWEYAARGEDRSKRYRHIDEVAWWSGNSQTPPSVTGPPLRTQDVGRKRVNGFGLYDMLGNVWEWVADVNSIEAFDRDLNFATQVTRHGADMIGIPGGALEDGVEDPQGPPAGEYGVLRGGSHDSIALGVRASARMIAPSTTTSRDIGFRCVGN
ncbi:MAG TPA: formylglycine-generating enzyme family protein [Bryobacteraceae bacterium]|nr:formylglycine-generating enzyme family protein [Bryobacteraceae bacterium]